MVEWSSTKERLNERAPNILVEWSFARINEREPYILVEWSFVKGRINERGPYILAEWSCENKINK